MDKEPMTARVVIRVKNGKYTILRKDKGVHLEMFDADKNNKYVYLPARGIKEKYWLLRTNDIKKLEDKDHE